MGALEQSSRVFAKNPISNVIQPTLGMSFDSLNEEYDFHNLYSFGIRYSKRRLNVKRTKYMKEVLLEN
jgi:hypothetical protein